MGRLGTQDVYLLVLRRSLHFGGLLEDLLGCGLRSQVREGELRRPDLPNFRVRRAARGPVLPKILIRFEDVDDGLSLRREMPVFVILADERRQGGLEALGRKGVLGLAPGDERPQRRRRGLTATPRPPTIALSEAVFGYWKFLSKYTRGLGNFDLGMRDGTTDLLFPLAKAVDHLRVDNIGQGKVSS